MRISDWSSDVCSSDLRKTIAWITGLPLHPVGIVDGNGAAAAEVDDQNREPDRRLAGGHGQHEHREHLPDEVAKRGAERDKIDITRKHDQLDAYHDDNVIFAVAAHDVTARRISHYRTGDKMQSITKRPTSHITLT